MPWSETNRMEERARFVVEALQGRFSMSELCFRYGVSRKTGYKWIERYHAEGARGCEDRSRASRGHPNATDPELVARVIRLGRSIRAGARGSCGRGWRGRIRRQYGLPRAQWGRSSSARGWWAGVGGGRHRRRGGRSGPFRSGQTECGRRTTRDSSAWGTGCSAIR